MARSLVLLGVLSACGDQAVGIDASTPVDASGDLVNVEVRSSLASDKTRVFFQRQDSTLVLATTTDADGRVQAYIPEHTMVTVDMVDVSGQHWLMTHLEVNPGDDVVFDDGTKPNTAQLSLTVPAPTNTGGFQVRAPCPVTAGGVELAATDVSTTLLPTALNGCEGSGSLIVEGFDFLTGAQLYLYRKNVVLADGVSLTFTGEYQPMDPLLVRAIHVPPKARIVYLQQSLLDGSHEMFPRRAETLVSYDGFAESVETPWFDETWPSARTIARASADSFGPGKPTVYEWGPRDDTTTTIDFGDDALHEYLTRPTYSEESNLVGWLESDQGRLADAVVIELSWFSQVTATSMSWRLFGPRREHTWVNVPVLPDPTLAAVGVSVASATNIAIDGGYERLRKLPRLVGGWAPSARFVNGQFIDSEWPIDAPTGRVVLQLLGNGGF